MKPSPNLHLALQPADLARLDHHRGRFHAFPLEREQIALIYQRYSAAQVDRRPGLLAIICRLFGESPTADIGFLDGPVMSDELRADIRACAAVRCKGEQDAFDYITSIGRTHGRMSGWQDGRGRL
jgi:hypothetical protein